jgi:hypothetical protein
VIIAVGSGAAADQGRTEIGPTDTFPIVIDEPGSYVLTADLTVTSTASNGIDITVDDVTLDLGGHVVRGPGGAGLITTGIKALDRSRVIVRNGTVTGFGYGLRLVASSDGGGNRIADLTASDCRIHGVWLAGGVARDIAVFDNGVDYQVPGFQCERCSATNITASSNTTGIRIEDGSALNCTANENTLFGIILSSATLTGGSANNNGGFGVNLESASSAIGVSASGNGGAGFNLTANGGNLLVNCTGADNAMGNQFGCGTGNGCHQNYLP